MGENLYGLREWENQWTAFEKFIGEKLLDGQEKKLTLDDLAKEQCDVIFWEVIRYGQGN